MRDVIDRSISAGAPTWCRDSEGQLWVLHTFGVPIPVHWQHRALDAGAARANLLPDLLAKLFPRASVSVVHEIGVRPSFTSAHAVFRRAASSDTGRLADWARTRLPPEHTRLVRTDVDAQLSEELVYAAVPPSRALLERLLRQNRDVASVREALEALLAVTPADGAGATIAHPTDDLTQWRQCTHARYHYALADGGPVKKRLCKELETPAQIAAHAEVLWASRRESVVGVLKIGGELPDNVAAIVLP